MKNSANDQLQCRVWQAIIYLAIPRAGALLFGSLYFWGGVAFALFHRRGAGLLSLLLAFIMVELLVNQSKYLFNDIRDANNDWTHPRKSSRAVAADVVSAKTAYLFGVVRALLGLGLSAAFTPALLPMTCFLLLTQFAYDRMAKPVPLLNAAVLALGCVWRFAAGYAAVAESWPVAGACALIYLQRVSIYMNSYAAEGRYLTRLGCTAAKPSALFYERRPLIAKLSFLPFLALATVYILRAGIPAFPAVGAVILIIAVAYYRVNGPGDRPHVHPVRYARLLPRLALRTARQLTGYWSASLGLVCSRLRVRRPSAEKMVAHRHLGRRKLRPNLQEVD